MTIVVALRPTTDGLHLLHQGVVAVGDSDVGQVGAGDVVAGDAFQKVVRAEPMLLDLMRWDGVREHQRLTTVIRVSRTNQIKHKPCEADEKSTACEAQIGRQDAAY